MTARPLLLTTPYLPMWVGLIVLSLAYAILCSLSAFDIYVGILIGPWTDVENPNASLGNTIEYLGRPPLSSICEYIRFNSEGVAVVEMPKDGNFCPILRLLSEGDGFLVDEKRSADPIIIFLRDIK